MPSKKKSILRKALDVATGTAANIGSAAKEQFGKPIAGVIDGWKNLGKNIKQGTRYDKYLPMVAEMEKKADREKHSEWLKEQKKKNLQRAIKRASEIKK
jgi:hypothetical protein